MKKKNPGAENIRVVIRCRDLLPYEAERGDKALIRLDMATNQVVVQHQIGDADLFAFDAVYNNTFTQRDIFRDEVRPLAEAVLQGFNATVFAYGQSGSGKTHTMTGKLSDKEQWGMMPQVIDYFFNEIKRTTSSTKSYKVKVSYVELYNGKSRDLLASKQVNLEIKQNAAKNFYVKGAEMPEVTSFDESIKWFNAGTERRQTASTDLNDTSSRSHSLFTIQIEQFDFENDPSSPIVMTSKMNVVDLAGSEKLSKTNATGDTAKEGCNINLSLSALATVIDTIVKGAKHIPYRGSPLTMLLKDSLGGNAKTVMFANIGPSDKNTSETISTLRFALRAKQIENKPLKNMDPKDARIQELMERIEELTKRLGNVDLNVEDDLRQRIEELEIENSDLRGSGDKNDIELEEQCRNLQAQLEEKDKEVAERQKELRKEVEGKQMAEHNLLYEQGRVKDLLSLNTNFIKRILTNEQLAKLKEKLPDKVDDDKWDVKEVGHFLQGFSEMYEKWRKTAYTKEDMEKYAKRAAEELQEQAQRQLNDLARERDDLLRQRTADTEKRTAENEAMSQLKVDLVAMREENAKLREKIERDQEKIKVKLAKTKEEFKALQDQLEASKSETVEKERDIERLKRMIDDNAAMRRTSLNTASPQAPAGAGGAADGGNSSELNRELERERRAREALESRIKETNVSLRRFGVCIADPTEVSGASSLANANAAFVLAAADENPIDDDIYAQLQQQVRTKQRLIELAHQQQTRLEDLIRKYELLKTGHVTAINGDGSLGVQAQAPAAAGGAIDEATANQIKELLQRKDDEIEQAHREKDQISEKLVKKLNKCDRRIKELETLLEDERAQFNEERTDLTREAAELQQFNQQLAVELETTRGLVKDAKETIEKTEREKESEAEYLKQQIADLTKRIDATRNKSAEYDEMHKSYQRLQQQMARLEAALKEKDESVANSRQMAKWSNQLAEQEKQKNEEYELTIRQQELEMRRQEEEWKQEVLDQVNKTVAANNRRLEAQAAQFQDLMAEEHQKQRSLQKKLKSAKANVQKVAQRYDEMILENESIVSKLEELKVQSMKLYLEKQEAQRDYDYRPTGRNRGL